MHESKKYLHLQIKNSLTIISFDVHINNIRHAVNSSRAEFNGNILAIESGCNQAISNVRWANHRVEYMVKKYLAMKKIRREEIMQYKLDAC